jgi:hypothetical protein
MPSFDSVDRYLLYAGGRIREAASTWKAFGYAASEAYSRAYDEQGRVLKEIQESLLKAREEEAQLLSLGLTILTVGVAGPVIAGKLKEVVEKGGEVVKDAAADLGKKAVEGSTELVKKYFEPASFNEAFRPAGIPPDQYGDELQETIEVETGVLEHEVIGFMEKGSAGMTMDGAKRLSESILNTDFIKNPPRLTDKRRLERYATLALWLAWAWARDRAYWEVHSIPTLYAKELSSFEPLRKVLREKLNIDPSIEQDALDWRRGVVKVMNMDKFIDWSWGSGGRNALLSGMPAHPLGRRYAERQMQEGLVKIALRNMGVAVADD